MRKKFVIDKNALPPVKIYLENIANGRPGLEGIEEKKKDEPNPEDFKSSGDGDWNPDWNDPKQFKSAPGKQFKAIQHKPAKKASDNLFDFDDQPVSKPKPKDSNDFEDFQEA